MHLSLHFPIDQLDDGELLIQILLNRMKKENPIMMDSLFVL